MKFPDINEANKMNTKHSILADFSALNDVLFIAFTGQYVPKNPRFNYFGQIKNLNTKVMLIRDLDFCWYQRGFKGYTNNVKNSVKLLVDVMKWQNCRKAVMVGSSMGGFASLLFGNELSNSFPVEVHSFSPQTLVTTKRIIKAHKGKAQKPSKNFIYKLKKSGSVDLLDNIKEYRNNFNLYYGDLTDDIFHAERLKGCVNLHYIEECKIHNIAKMLRNQNKLGAILRGSIYE